MKNNQVIKKIKAREIFDSRGNPTIEAIVTAGDFKVSASVPSGASTGALEAVELRDGGSRFGGLGVLNAVRNVNEIIAPAIIGKDPRNQKEIDQIMIDLDGTPNKSKLGANAILAISQAVTRLGARIEGKELYRYLGEMSEINGQKNMPHLYINLINGGKHAKSKLAFQEYHAVCKISDPEKIFENIFMLQKELRRQLSGGVGDEGGFIIDTEDIEKPLTVLSGAIKKLKLEDEFDLALDVAASSFYKNGRYSLAGLNYGPESLLDIYKKLSNKYNILSIEDPFEENDFGSFASAVQNLKDILIVGDDLTVTNKERLTEAVEKKSIGGVIIKPNQIGTISEVIETVKLAGENGIKCIVSHRSGETNDDFIADLSVAIGAFGIKLGAMQRGERVAKYNRLKKIFSNEIF